MRQGRAFKFIPELIGDFSHAMELSANPILLYVEAAVSTLHMVSNVYGAISEYINTKKKTEFNHLLEKKKIELVELCTEDSLIENLCILDNNYEKVKIKLREGKFRDDSVRTFIRCIEKELKKITNIMGEMPIDQDYSERDKVEEVMRRALRDYNNILKLSFEEEDTDGKTGTE